MANPKEIRNLNKAFTQMLELISKLGTEFTQTSKDMTEGLKAINDQAAKNLKSNDKLTTSRKEHREEITKEQKEAQNLIKAKKALEQSQLKQSELTLLLRKQRQDLIKEQKLQIQAGKGEAKTYEQLSARYRLAAKRAKDLTVQYGANNEMARDAVAFAKQYNDQLKEIDASLGNSQRNVGNYTSALEGMGGALEQAGGSMGGLIGGFKEFMSNPYAAVFTAISGAIVGIVAALKNSRSGSVALEKSMTTLSATTDVAKNRFSNWVGEVADGKKSAKEIIGEILKWNSALQGNVAVLAQTTGEMQGQIKEVANLKRELIDLNDAYIDIENELLVQIATQQGLADQQKAIADDNTRSLQERRAAAQAAFEIEQDAGEAAVLLAQERLAISEKEIEVGIKAGALLREQDGTIRSLTADGIELEKAYSEAAVTAIDASNQLALTRLENQKRLSEINQDDFEQELDFLLDIADAQKTVNEQQIADTNRAFEERSALLLNTKALIEESFNDQTALFKEQLGVELERNKILDLNNKEIFEYARGLELSEIATNRLREVIIERRKAIQDLEQAQRDLNAELFEGLDAQFEGMGDDLVSEIDKTLLAEENALKDSLKRQEAERVKAARDEVENFKKKEEQKKEAAETAGGLLLDTLTLFAEQRIELAEMETQAADAAVNAAERNLDRQIALAEAGYANNVQQAQRDLDLAKTTQNKALDEKKRALEQKQRLETIEQGVSIITAVANIIQGFSSIPIVGWVLGIAAGAAMIAAFAQQKSKAKQEAQTFGDGGVIDLQGGSHSSGNDILIGHKDGVEMRAEGGEKQAIFSRKASRKYGSVIDNFVNSANKMQLEDRYSSAFALGGLPVIVENRSGYDSKDMRDMKRILSSIDNKIGESMGFDPKGRQVQKKGNIKKYIS
jgi:hypothetical protein